MENGKYSTLGEYDVPQSVDTTIIKTGQSVIPLLSLNFPDFESSNAKTLSHICSQKWLTSANIENIFVIPAICLLLHGSFFSQDIFCRLLGLLSSPDNHAVVILQRLEPGLDVGSGVLERLLVFNAQPVAKHGAADLGDELLPGVGRLSKACNDALALTIAARSMHRRVSELVEGSGIILFSQSVL